jgi:RNA polymerase sigma-70 factor (sigma-E family)
VNTEVEFATFVRTHTPELFRSGYLLTRNVTAAEDLVQETFTRLYPKWSRVVDADAPLAYVRRSMVNNFVNSRRGKRGNEVLLADPPERLHGPDPAAQVSDQDLVRRMLDSLPPRPRAVLVLRFYHDLTDADIAADLGCREATVRSIVSRALANLREQSVQQSNQWRSDDSIAPLNGMTP